MGKPGIKITGEEISMKWENRRFFFVCLWKGLTYELYKSWTKSVSILPLKKIEMLLPTVYSSTQKVPEDPDIQ